jgi:hypothetical protein
MMDNDGGIIDKSDGYLEGLSSNAPVDCSKVEENGGGRRVVECLGQSAANLWKRRGGYVLVVRSRNKVLPKKL